MTQKKTGVYKRARQENKRPPSRKHVENGLYFDFEGFGKNSYQLFPPPVLCGYRFGGKGPVQHAVFNKDYRWAAESDTSGRVSYVGNQNRKDFLMDLLDQQTRGGKKIFFFSGHEPRCLKEILGINIQKRLKDLLPVMKKKYPELTRGNRTLIGYCKLCGIDVPKDYGKGRVTEKFRNVREYSRTRSGWIKAPNKIKRQWELLLDHNRFDVECMYDLAKKSVN